MIPPTLPISVGVESEIFLLFDFVVRGGHVQQLTAQEGGLGGEGGRGREGEKVLS